MTIEEVNAAFEKFYAASPFVGRGEDIRIAMQGSFTAGYTLLAEELIKHYKK